MHAAVRGLAGAVACAIAVAAAVSGPARADAIATLRGTVIDRTTRSPVVGAVITVGGELAATGDDGAFTLALPRGTYRIEVAADWIEPAVVPVALAGDRDLVIEVDARAEAGGERIEVVGVAPTQIGETRVDAKLARAVPGGGDAAKVVQSLPAVARPPAGSAEIVVWGAAPRDTRVFVDGVPVPALYHLGGYRAAVGNELVGDIRLTPAAFAPDRGRAIGGVIDIGTADPSTLPRARVQADFLDATAAAGNLALDGAGAVVLAAAVRRSWLDRAIDAVADPQDLAPNAPLPTWSDAQVAVRATLPGDLVLTGWVIGARDTLARTLASDDPATQVEEDVTQAWLRAQVTLRRERPGAGDSVTLWVGRDRDDEDLAVGTITAHQHVAQWVGGARAQQRSRLAGTATLTVGVDVDGERARIDKAGSLSIPAREGDLHIFGQPPGDDVAVDRWSATTIDAAGHATVDLQLGRVTAALGARVDTWVLAASRLTPRVGTTPGIARQDIIVTEDPRASVQVRLTESAGIRADAGRYHQARAATDTSAVFGTPSLGLEAAWHVTVGGQLRRAPFAIEAAGYARWLDGLVARDPAVTPRLAQVLTQDGSGRVHGVQVTARVIGWRGLSGWLSYGYSRSTRKDTAGGTTRFFDRDQTHGFIAVGGWEHGRWNVGGRVRVSTGEPRTDVLGAFFDSRSGRYQPIRGAHNGVRLPMFFAADLRAEVRLGSGAIYVELQNLTGRANAEEIVYSADFSERGYLTSLPLLAIAGARVDL
jgi:hypothetical protein